MKFIFFLSVASAFSPLLAWEEDPRIEQHNKLTDNLLQLGQVQAEEKDREKLALLYPEQPTKEENDTH